jgi:hypothetical protein
VGSVVDKVALGQVFSEFFSLPVIITPPFLHNHSCIIWESDNGPVNVNSSIVSPHHNNKNNKIYNAWNSISIPSYTFMVVFRYIKNITSFNKGYHKVK